MCGCFTDLYTWDDIYAYRSLIGETPTNWGPSFNVCPTDQDGVVMPPGDFWNASMSVVIAPP